jgi:hypothetical protein
MPVHVAERAPERRSAPLWHPAALGALCYLCLLALHAGLLRLPYFWDEAGYYVPAARDLLLTGSLVPHSTLSNAHPPLLLAYLALAWKIFGYSPLVTRCAMLLVAAFALVGVFRLARHAANTEVATASMICTALYPVFFAQSSLALVDLGAAAFLIWGLDYYLLHRRAAALVFFSLAALTKETAILVPLALFLWELLLRTRKLRSVILSEDAAASERPGVGREHAASESKDLASPPPPAAIINRQSSIVNSLALLLPCLPLAGWFGFHYARTGYIFGNPEFFAYNLGGTLNPLRFVAALALRLWHLFGYMNMLALTAAMLIALTLPPLVDRRAARGKARGNGHPEVPRRPIAPPVQAVFYVVILVHLLALSILGGAVLARYLLPVYPLLIIVAVSTMRRRLPWWPAFVAVVCLSFVIALVTEPPYRFAPEDNLAYADYVRLHQAADEYTALHASGRVLTAWPASDELTRPWLGYVPKPVPVLAIENFSAAQLFDAAQAHSQYQFVLLFSTKEEPRLLFDAHWWERIQTRFFGYHRDLRPAEAARLLGARIVYERHLHSQWVAVLRVESVENARVLEKY